MSQTADRFVWCAILNISELHSISITADVRTLLEPMWYCCCCWVFLGNVICDRNMNMIVFMYNYDHDDALRLSAVNCPRVYSDFLQHCFHFLRYYSRCFVFFSRHHLILRVSRVFRADNVYKSYNVESVSLLVFSYTYKYTVGLWKRHFDSGFFDTLYVGWHLATAVQYCLKKRIWRCL